MKATRSNLPYLIAGAAGALLFLLLFLKWLGSDAQSLSAWKIFSWADIALAILGLSAAAIGASRVFGFDLPVPWLRGDALKWIAAIATTITLTLLIELSTGRLGQADIQFGGWLAILACLAMVAGAVLANRPDLAARVADAAGVDEAGGGGRPAARPPAGLGGGSTTTTPTGGGAASPPASPVGGSSAPGAGPSGPGTGASGPAGGGAPAAGGAAGPGATGAAGVGGAAPEAGAGGATGSGPPAGWYPDPQGQARLRYWDGAAWTEQTSS